MHGTLAASSYHRRLRECAALILLASLSAVPLQAQDWMGTLSPWSTLTNPMPLSPWSGITSPFGLSTQSPWSAHSLPMTQAPWTSLSPGYGGLSGAQWPGLSALNNLYQQPHGIQSMPYVGHLSTCQDPQGTGSLQPDLTGYWRGSGGESVEVQRNVARIWGGEDKPCNCVFFLVGQRLIAYSPDTDIVRKYWYQSGGNNQFSLTDESGNVMTYQRLR